MKQLNNEEASNQMDSSTDEEESDSYSQQSSSDTTKDGKTQQFSVSRSDTNGLRMKISAIRNVDNNTTNSKISPIHNNNSKSRATDIYSSQKRRKRKVSTATSSSCCSICSRTESDFSSEAFPSDKPKKTKTKRKKMISGVGNQIKESKGSTDSEEDSDKNGLNGKTLPSSLINIDQTQSKKIPQCDVLQGSCISSSDNELPALVNAAIKCVESGSEADNNILLEPSKQYTSTLLRDFMVKTQMLGNSSTNADTNFSAEVKSSTNGGNDTLNTSTNISYLRRRRGRPKKFANSLPKGVSLESADSGITSTAQSLSPSPNSHNKRNMIRTHKESGTQKINISSLDKQMYATERVLYPPKGRKQNTKQNIKAKTSNEDMLDPLWKKIDVNMKFRRPSLSGYKSDGGTTICSKILAARSGYVSDFCSIGNRIYSGYKSDVSGKSRSSIKSYVSRAKSCDYRCGYITRKHRKIRKRNNSLIKSSKSLGNVNEQDILQLAGLSLGQTSEDSSRESVCKPILLNCQSKKYGEINRFVRTGEYYGRNRKTRIEDNTFYGHTEQTLDNTTTLGSEAYNTKISNSLQCQISFNEYERGFPKKIRSRRSSAISRCSSFSASSRNDTKRKRRRKLKLKSVKNGYMDSKLNTEIEILTNNLSLLQLISFDKSNTKEKEKEKIPGVKNLGKRNVKKRKLSENVEYHMPNVALKRRHKKAGHSNPDEHKLPLKKRHYLLTPGEKSDSKNIHILDIKSKDMTIDNKISSTKSSINNNLKITSKAITPKKRHLLETGDNVIIDDSINSITKPNYSPSICESKLQSKADAIVDTISQKGINQGKIDKEVTKKKNRLEVLVSKMHNSNHSIKDGVQVSIMPTSGFPPPGVFEPSMELEIQIPVKLSAGTIMKSEVDSPKLIDFGDLEKPLSEPKSEGVLESLLNKTANNLLLKRKRRKTFNRTGFPTIKRKKRKTISECSDSFAEIKYRYDNAENDTSSANMSAVEASKLCDRVPCVGEASDSFLERHRQPRLSVVSLEKLQEPVKKQEDIENSEVVVRIPRKTSLKDALDKCPSNIICKNEIINKVEMGKNNIQSKRTEKSISSATRNSKTVYCSRTLKNNEINLKTDEKLRQIKERNYATVDIQHATIKKGKSTKSRQQLIKEKLQVKTKDVNNSIKSINKTRSLCGNLKTNKIYQKESSSELSVTEDLEQEPLPPNEGPKTFQSTSDSSDNGIRNKRVTKWRKSYITAGLLSDFYKTNKTKRSPREMVKRRCDLFTSTHTSNLLPPPPYCEKFLRRTIRDFLLPYDIWWAYQNSKLPSRVTVPSWNYKKIRTNVYGDVRPNPTIDHQACNCKPQSACGDDCLNRMVYTECSPSNCPCGEKCQNQKIQRHDIAPGIERFMTENKGWGVRTNLPIKKGTYILEYVGEVVTEKEFKERMATLYVNDTHHYCLHLDGGLVIDGHRMGSDGRFVNHSCSPNCEMQKWSVNGLFRMALFASRNIQAGEELTYDYNFSLFNPSEGQPCRCETPQCRGVIGGKSQRIKPLESKPIEAIIPQRNSRPRKRQARRITNRLQTKDVVVSAYQQLSDREKRIVWGKKCFLIRNLEKVRKMKIKMIRKTSETSHRPLTPSSLAAQISALRVPRNIRTRGLTQAEHDPEVERMAKIAIVLREICTALENVKDCEGKSQISKLLQASKRKRNLQERNYKIIDFPTVQSKIEKGFYKDPELFDEDINKVFSNALTFFGSDSEEGKVVGELIKVYLEKKNEVYDRLLQIVPDRKLTNFRRPHGARAQTNSKTHEDIIQCICGLFKDEGLMIQCSKCLVWQHAECTKANVNADNYLCEKCEPRVVDFEIPLDEYTEEGYRYYLSLLRGTLQIRQTDTVYVLRDIPVKDESGKICATKKHTYQTIGKIDYSECDIFRVERLWKDSEGRRFIFGHHYLRPHETFHEPTRKFYENEVIRVPLYEVVPIELVIARCWVLDRGTFCKGRPVDCTSEEHVYICELRVDRSARFFSKAKQSYPTCTKNYAFKRFPEKLKISRNYAPHEVDPALIKPKKKKNEESSIQQKKSTSPVIQLMPPPTKTINEKRLRLEEILKALRRRQTLLLDAVPVDLSYLLTGRGARHRRALAVNVPI